MSALTTWLTAIADAIRGKDGTEDPIDHADFPAKITAIPQLDTSGATAVESDLALGKTAFAGGVELTGTSTLNADTTDATLTANDMLYGVTGYGPDGTKLTGAGAMWQEVTGGSFQDNTDFPPEDFTIHLPKAKTLGSAFQGCTQLKTVTLNLGADANSFISAFQGCTALIEATLNCPWGNLKTLRQAFYNCTKLKRVLGSPIRFDVADGLGLYQAFQSCSVLEEVRFERDTIIYDDINMGSSPNLSTESLISIANGMNTGCVNPVGGFHATSKTNMNNIRVDNVGGLAVLGSTMTLTAFINNIKGWTIA